MDIKRIILIKGAVETLEFFSLQLAEAFTEHKIPAWFWDMRAPLGSREAFCALADLDASVLLTFNFIGFSGESQFQSEHGGTLWEQYGVTSYCIMVDHPIYYYKRLRSHISHMRLVCIDRGHKAFVEKFYPFYGKAGFLPLGGTPLPGTGIPFQERTTDVIFTGNFVPVEHLMPHIRHMDEESRGFYFDIIQELIEHPCIPLEKALISRLEGEFPQITREETLSCLHGMVFIDLYLRTYFRQKVVCCLADHGVRLLAIGKDWEKAGCRRPENIRMAGMQDSLACLKAMGNAKIALNIMPWFKDGAHDRIFNGMLQGCAVVTDSSAYLDEILLEGRHYAGFSLEHYEEAAQKAKELLAAPGKAEELAQNGFQAASQGHTWAHRASELLRMMEGSHCDPSFGTVQK